MILIPSMSVCNRSTSSEDDVEGTLLLGCCSLGLPASHAFCRWLPIRAVKSDEWILGLKLDSSARGTLNFNDDFKYNKENHHFRAIVWRFNTRTHRSLHCATFAPTDIVEKATRKPLD